MDDAPEPLLLPAQVAALLGMSVQTTKDWMRRGRLPTVKVGRRGLLRMRQSDYRAYIDGLELVPKSTATKPPRRRPQREIADAVGVGVATVNRDLAVPDGTPEPESEPAADEVPVPNGTPDAEDAEDLAVAAAAIEDPTNPVVDFLRTHFPDDELRVLHLPDDTEGRQDLAAALDALVNSEAYEAAAARIDTTPELDAFRDVILHDWPEGDAHFTWAATCDLAELLSWAQAVARDAEEEGEP